MGRKDIKLVNCHLGNGSSLSAVKDGKCQDTSMGLTPLAGVPMGTRSGDIDPAVVQFVMNKYGMSADECLNMLNKKSGVLALSGVSSDFRDIENGAEEGNENCALALDKFAYEVRKYIGSYAAALGGLDCLVFTAGVGENSASMRARICEGLEFLGVKLDPEKNNTRGEEAIISAADSKVTVWVIPTNEELMIAQDTAELVICLNEEKGIFLREADYPYLKNHAGKHLIVTDGTTLLGADDKAGVAEIMTAAQQLLAMGGRHATLKIGFTP